MRKFNINDVSVFERNGLYGILDNNDEVVTPMYKDFMLAVYEWEYFEKKNTPDCRFLPHIRSEMDIFNIVCKLKEFKNQ